eukprot:TRINITY_DN27677_c0_g1_i1.p1 TRINITY_DN27677_c0_g1~~TRINITY_DN27677_c0_g1_i1.p1  ORF type:complete len:137 (-),score=10.87 TRINITY_DN27677_c0_g1_i1:84-494(-)
MSLINSNANYAANCYHSLCGMAKTFLLQKKAAVDEPLPFVGSRQHGLWSKAWASQITSWDEHIGRAHTSWSRVQASLVSWRGADWIMQQRLFSISRANFGSVSGLGATRTDTRAAPGFVPKRWVDALTVAKDIARC